MARSAEAEERFRNQVYRRCCMCKYTKRVATDFTPTSRRCTTCAPIYYKQLAERRAAGEPPRQRKAKPVELDLPEPVVEEVVQPRRFGPFPPRTRLLLLFLKISAVGHVACGNAPPTP